MCTNFYIQDHLSRHCQLIVRRRQLKVIYMSHGEVKGRRGFILGGVFSASYLAGIHFDCWEGALEILKMALTTGLLVVTSVLMTSVAFPGYLVQLNANNIVFANNFGCCR